MRDFIVGFRSKILWLQNYLHLPLLIDSIPISFSVVLNKYLMKAGMSGLLCLRAFDILIYDSSKSTRDEWWLLNYSLEVWVKFNGET